jgi:hypothetical protein
LSLHHLFVQQRLDADTACFGSEVTTQGISASKPSPATPLAPNFEITLANKLLLARVQTFVPFAVVLSGKGLSTDSAYKGTFVGVGSQM